MYIMVTKKAGEMLWLEYNDSMLPPSPSVVYQFRMALLGISHFI